MDRLSQPLLTRESFEVLGLDSLVYIRPVRVNGRRVHIIHAADGTPLTMVPDRDVAWATVRQNELNPMSLH